MSHYDLMAFDMDGTLLDNRKHLLPSSIEAVQRASEAGKQIVIATGRCVSGVQEYLDLLPSVRYVICMNGGMVYDLQNECAIFDRPIPRDIVSKLLDITEPRDTLVQFMCFRIILERDTFANIALYHSEQYEDLFRRTAIFCEDLRAYYTEYKPNLYKFTPYCKTLADLDEFLPQIRELGLEVVYTEETGAECTVQGISKATGLTALCKHLNIPLSRTIAIGDANNDLQIMRTAGLSIAMGNANEDVKAVAKAVVSDNEHNGCAEAINRYLLG